jgi:hypothetical protein
MLITDLGQILSGTSFPQKILNEPDCDYLVIESESVNSQGAINLEGAKCISNTQHPLPKNRLHKNDILIRAKGSTHQAIIFEENSKQPVVATSYFLIIRIHDQDKLPPAYAVSLLNQKIYQHKLSSLAGGSTVKHLTKKRLSNLTICLPPIDKLKLIYDLDVLVKQEQAMELLLSQYKKELYEAMTNELIR